jgi:putative endonuclease
LGANRFFVANRSFSIVENSKKNNRKQTGALGEQAAVRFLMEKNYEILARNWRSRKAEIDIIARCEQTLHFVEVKSRTGKSFGLPEHRVNALKLQMMKAAAGDYLALHPEWKQIQFDIISVYLLPRQAEEILHIEDVF